jgi:hypothetical protein
MKDTARDLDEYIYYKNVSYEDYIEFYPFKI